MTQADFIKKLEKKLEFLSERYEQSYENIILGNRERLGPNTFESWIKKELDIYTHDPLLDSISMVTSGAKFSPDWIARTLAGIINIDLDENVDWSEQWKMAELKLSNFNPEKVDGGKFKGWFRDYVKAIELDKRIIVLSRFIEPEQTTDPRPLAPYFNGSDKLDLALKAAEDVGLIHKGIWKFEGYKTNALSVFWKAAVTAGLAKADAPVYKVTKACKEQFSITHLGPNAIDKNRKYDEFGDDFTGLHNQLLAIMRP